MLTYWSDLENSVQFVLLACRNWWMLILPLGNAWMKLFVCTTQLKCWICWKFCTELASSMGTSSLIISSYVVTGVFRSALCCDNRHYADGTHFQFSFFMILISYEYFLRDWCPFWNVVWSLFSLSEVHILQWGLGRVAAWSAWALETSGLIFYEWYMQAVDRHEWYLFYVYAVEENEQVLDRPWIPKVNFLLVIPLYKKAPILVQGLCLIDWGRSIDTALFPEGMKFIGDSNTVAFRCIEMLEKRPWTFEVALWIYVICLWSPQSSI